ncbi:uncharacterized protein F5147DRAFT_778116 [Suillus discolor]|uniref:Uncharacterized protein n=1 Tax=Suillus discolor TaxID=1912936 RepID=A0A9P7JPH9_9AGAM|nr:uncharacterized protein F5147DRAFT_778116 [Suillus discolor]KAG2096972.1 hypothetical protein F5147DRAFT_778116 [Suillus discolor]
MVKIGKRSNRGWWWDHFVEHPGYAVKDPASMVSGKAKVVCARLYEQCVAREQAMDELPNVFSRFARITPLLSTETLTLLAELKMYVHEEHVRNDVVKKRLQRRYCDTEATDKAEPTQVVHAVGDDLSGESSEREPRSLAFERRGISDVAADLIRAVQEEEEEISATESMHSVPIGAASAGGSFSRIAINELLDYSHAELELYELLDLDAEGIDDPDFPQVDDVLDE